MDMRRVGEEYLGRWYTINARPEYYLPRAGNEGYGTPWRSHFGYGGMTTYLQ